MNIARQLRISMLIDNRMGVIMDKLTIAINDTKKRESLKRRLFEKVVRAPSGCLEWTASTHQFGYGLISAGRKMPFKTHRVAWALEHGPIPDGLLVCHKCDNPKCVEVAHLFLGTPLENMRDKERKGRRGTQHYPKGEEHHNTKFNEEVVRYIRASNERLSKLANDFNVSEMTIRRIKKRESWKHVE